MRWPLHHRLSLFILYVTLLFFSSYSLQRIPSSSLMTFSVSLLDSSSSLSFTVFLSSFCPHLISLYSCTFCLKPTTEVSLDYLSHSKIHINDTAGGIGRGAACWAVWHKPGSKGKSASKTFWICEPPPTLGNFSAQFQLEMVELSFFHAVLHSRCETSAMAS